MKKKELKNKIDKFPDTPGVYMFKGPDGLPLYVGKAKSLRKRVLAYVSEVENPRLLAMVIQAEDIEIIPLKTESEALVLEDRLIKEYQPRYNIEWKDDKKYPLLKIDITEKWPRLQFVRREKDDNALYFGPFTHSGGLRNIMRLIRKVFKIRCCKYKNLKPEYATHCLYYHMGECLAPCRGEVDPIKYQEIVKQVIMLLEGRVEELLTSLRKKMMGASKRMEFEKAAKIRDLIFDIEKLLVEKVRKEVIKGKIELPQTDIDKELDSLKQVLGLPERPVYIDAFDISNLYGTNPVGSLIVFKDGKAYKKGYKRFKIKTVEGIDDYAMLAEVIGRHYQGVVGEGGELPDLILIDGGKGHLNAACNILTKLGLTQISVIALAKRLEEIYIPSRKRPILLEKDNPALKLLMRIRDEAHRFAISYHRKLRKKMEKLSILDEIEGIGPKRKKKLLRRFGSVDELKRAGIKELKEVVPERIARELKRKLEV